MSAKSTLPETLETELGIRMGRETIALPPPRRTGGRSLHETFALRRSTRSFSSRPLSLQVISDVLWAAIGVNRPGGERTVPCWRHLMVLDLYVATSEGVGLYDPRSHRILPHLHRDLRAMTGTQDFVGTAPLDLVYVAHGESMGDLGRIDQRLYASVDAAFCGQNVYLFCASEGLGTVFRGALDAVALSEALALPDGQFVTFAQTIGYPTA